VIRNNRGSGRFIIPGDIRRREEPFIGSGLPSFVTVKGGDYFFIPSLTALRLLAAGSIDPRSNTPSCAGSTRASKADVRVII
jgi:hypothetical protein